MNLRHHFRRLNLIVESSAFVFQICKAVSFLNNGESHPSYYHLEGSNHNTSTILCFPWTIETHLVIFLGKRLRISIFSTLMNTFT